MRQTVESILRRTVKLGQCRVWTGATDKDGYPKGTYVEPDGTKCWRTVQALCKRLGMNIEGKVIMQKCHNRRCLNPDHLELIGRNQLRSTVVEADRQAKGEQMAQAFLTNQQYLEMKADRAKGYSYAELSRMYGYKHRCGAWQALNRGWKFLNKENV